MNAIKTSGWNRICPRCKAIRIGFYSAYCRPCRLEQDREASEKMTETRFMSYINKTNTCWEWRGGKSATGYGIFWILGKCEGAHRLSYVIHKGAIDEQSYVLHTCDNRGCVNPAHLYLGDAKDNAGDCVKRNRHHEKVKTHCPKGHPYSGANLISKPNGWRACRACTHEWAKKRL